MNPRHVMALFTAAALGLAACGSSDNNNPAADCTVGKWTAVESGYTKSFTFNADLTGTEDQSAVDNNRPFTWAANGNKLHIIYPASGDHVKSEWDIGPLDCAKKELTALGLVYRKN